MTAHPIDTDRLLARIARLEAQSDIRGRAVAIYQQRAREAEAERDWNLRSSRLAKEERIKANARADQAEARIKAVRELHTGTRRRGITGKPICDACARAWPCPTVRALDGEQ